MILDRLLDRYIDKYLKERELGYFSIKQKVFLFRELSFLIEGWVSIVDAVLIIKSGTDKWSIKKICDEMYNALNKGETLSYSMGELPRYFNQGDNNIIRSGEESWELTRVLKYLADEYEFIHNIKSKYVSAMIYPSLLFTIAILAVFLLFTNILPGIFDIIVQFDGVQIPPETKAMMIFSSFLQKNTIKLILWVFIVGFIWTIVFSTNDGKRFLDEHIFHLPLVGKLTQYYDMVKFMRYMRLLMEAGMNFLDVFIFLKDIMPNMSYKEAIDDIIWAINRWETIWATLEKYTHFIAKDVVALLKVGEETASFESALTNAIRMYEDEFQKVLEWVSKAIEPMLIVFIGWVVAMVAVSVFGVIGSLLDSVQA